ncbi:MAG TPA: hypothetical protein VNT23_02425 [Gaiellaceae bacterium]|nr:hypothetical protein [Gaiellaceae bacterium]
MSALAEPPLSPPSASPSQPAPAPSLADQRKVVVRLSDGETILVGMAPSRERATALARAWIDRLSLPEGEWPQIGERFVRPEAIVSVDVLRWS